MSEDRERRTMTAPVEDGFLKMACPYCGEQLLESPSGTIRIKCSRCRRILMIHVDQEGARISR